jgi:putative polymerase
MSMSSYFYSAEMMPLSRSDSATRGLAHHLVFGLLLATLVYQCVLCLINTHAFAIHTSTVALAEFLIYGGCLVVLLRNVKLEWMAMATLVAAYLFLLALLRGALDIKGFRDIVIVILFYWLGRTTGDIRMADRLLKTAIVIVLAFGFFELLFLDLYSRVFNVFSYYVNQGGLSGAKNWAEGSSLALNGMRPAGIGRTILPALLGNHRVSSIFLEPVSLGNFAVIVAAWGLSKERAEWRQMLFFVIAAVVMITLADSRYGMLTVAALILLRCVLVGRMHMLAILLPALCIATLLAMAVMINGMHADTIIGRLYLTGTTLLGFGSAQILGLQGYDSNFGDMGYAVILTRFGLLFFVVLWASLWMIRMQDQRGVRFRAYIALYISLILAISGTSLMALKTAGILWFLIGCCAWREQAVAGRKNERTNDNHGNDTAFASNGEVSHAN